MAARTVHSARVLKESWEELVSCIAWACLICCYFFTDIISSKEEIHETIFDGREIILKLFGIYDGDLVFKGVVRTGAGKCMSRER